MLLKLIFIIFSLLFTLNASEKQKCVYISSYHKGYSWSDEIEKTIKIILKDSCELHQFDMDTKRNKDLSYIKQKAKEAKELIQKVKPDVVIVSDDNAAKYVIKNYFNNSEIPFVFCGINWTAKEYNFSQTNVTGMIEITPIKQLYKLAKNLTDGKRAFFIGDDTLTDRKDFLHFLEVGQKRDVFIDSAFVNSMEEWKEAYLYAQNKYDFIVLGHNSAIKDWDDDVIKEFLLQNSKKLVLTTYSWMMPFSMVGLIIKAEEQGQWAANTAKAILNGFPIEQISITTNKTWDTSVNLKLLESTNIKLSRQFIVKSKKVQ